MKEITVEDIYTSKRLATAEIKDNSDLDNFYHLLLCHIGKEDRFIVFVNVNNVTPSNSGKGYTLAPGDGSIIFIYEQELHFDNKPTKNDIIKEMV